MPEWTKEEKLKLLELLKKHGSVDIESISEQMPLRSFVEIKNIINYYERLATMNLEDYEKNDSPLDLWIETTVKHSTYDILNPVSRALKYIMLFEPEHETVSGVNLKDCYELLYNISEGKSPKNVSGKTKLFLISLLKEVAKNIKRDDTEKAKEFLLSDKIVSHIESKPKTYGKPIGNDETKFVEVINPLQIPEGLYKTRNVSQDASEEDDGTV